MMVLWKGMQVTLGLFLLVGLLFASGVFGFLLYGKITGLAPGGGLGTQVVQAEAASIPVETEGVPAPLPDAPAAPAADPRQSSAMIVVPVIRQNPELPSGCELTSLTMLLQHYGINKSKMELLPEMKRDTTPIRYNEDGSIAYWGNPNLGFVGAIDGSAKGFGIYHTALFELLQKYVPSAVDLTKQPFEKLENQLIEGKPVVVWTTIDFRVPKKWSVWDSPLGPIQTTFMEHAVLLVGFDEKNVYINDPLSGRSRQAIDKAQFLATWEAMGRQALSYTTSP